MRTSGSGSEGTHGATAARGAVAIAALAALAALPAGAAPDAGAPGGGAPTRITIWAAAAADADSESIGGTTYAGPAGALIVERREVDLTSGELRLPGVAATIDPASVHLRDLTEPAAAITEQRFIPGAATPTELLARHVGDPITLVTARGESSGVLRAVDDHTLVVELGEGAARRLSVLRREHVQDVRLPAGGTAQPTLAWRIAARRPGKHAVELAYRATGLGWSADYLAVLDDQARTVDFSAWATIKNGTGAAFDRAELTLVSGSGPGAAAAGTGMGTGPTLASLTGAAAKAAPAPRFTLPREVRLGAGDAVQVELVPARTAVKTQPVVSYEPIVEDPSPGYQEVPGADCTENSLNTGGNTELALEIAMPAQVALPEGRVRLFRRQGDRLDLLGEDQLRASAGSARLKLSGDTEITGERKAVTCNLDERARTIHEKVAVRVENKGKQAVDVVIREYLWRWPVSRIESEDHKSARVAPQTLEYRVRVPGNGAQTVNYAVIYTW